MRACRTAVSYVLLHYTFQSPSPFLGVHCPPPLSLPRSILLSMDDGTREACVSGHEVLYFCGMARVELLAAFHA